MDDKLCTKTNTFPHYACANWTTEKKNLHSGIRQKKTHTTTNLPPKWRNRRVLLFWFAEFLFLFFLLWFINNRFKTNKALIILSMSRSVPNAASRFQFTKNMVCNLGSSKQHNRVHLHLKCAFFGRPVNQNSLLWLLLDRSTRLSCHELQSWTITLSRSLINDKW